MWGSLPLPPRHSEPRREVEETAVQTEVGGEGRACRDEDKGECDRKRPGHDQVLHHCGASVPYASIDQRKKWKYFQHNCDIQTRNTVSVSASQMSRADIPVVENILLLMILIILQTIAHGKKTK